MCERSELDYWDYNKLAEYATLILYIDHKCYLKTFSSLYFFRKIDAPHPYIKVFFSKMLRNNSMK